MNEFIKSNIVLSSIVIFMFLFMIVIITKPSIIFNKKGDTKEFGVGRKDRTILPFWLVAILVSILTYFFVSMITILI